MDLAEARRNLDLALGENIRIQYFSYLSQWFRFNPTLTKEAFDEKVRSLFITDEQVRCHSHFLLAILNKACLNTKPPKPIRPVVNNKGVFEAANYADYVQPKDSNETVPSHYPKAANELFVPYSGFIACRINIVAWECGMEGADSEVTQLVAHACQTFLKNIITAMVTKAKGFKIRDNKLQYGFNMPIPDPYVKNSQRVVDDSSESNVVDEELLLPKSKKSLEMTMNERAFAYAASKRLKTDVTLNTKLLYETIRDNPKLFGQHGIYSVQKLKLSLHDDRNMSHSEEEEDSDNYYGEG